MKKYLSLIVFSISAIISFAQTKVGSYYSGSFAIDLTGAERNTVWDSIAAVNGYSGSTLDSVVVDDQSPATVDSAAYIVFYGDYHGTKIVVGYYLTKSSNHSVIEYLIDDDNTSVARAWQCTATEACSSHVCKPKRNWFLGPVVGCYCSGDPSTYCEFVYTGSSWWNGVSIIISIIVSLVT